MCKQFYSVSISADIKSGLTIDTKKYTVIDKAGYAPADNCDIIAEDDRGLIYSFNSKLFDKETAKFNTLFFKPEYQFRIDHFSYTTSEDPKTAISEARRVMAAYVYNQAIKLDSGVLKEYAKLIRGRDIMRVKISETAYIGSRGPHNSSYESGLKELMRGEWYEIDEQFLFENQYNLISPNLRIYDSFISAIENDPRENCTFKTWGGIKPANKWNDYLLNYIDPDNEINTRSCPTMPHDHRLEQRFDNFHFYNWRKTDFDFLVYDHSFYEFNGIGYTRITSQKQLPVCKYARKWLIYAFDINL